MAKYAENTEVPVDRSKNEIERILKKYGADSFMYASMIDQAMIAFRLNMKHIRFIVPFPCEDEFETTPTGRTRKGASKAQAYEQEIRRRWRALALSIKGKLEAVETGIVSFEEEFMAYIVLPDGKTAGDHMIPQIEDVYRTGKMPQLLPLFGT